MKRMKATMIACLLGVMIVRAQDEKGIHFEDGLSWQQVQEKAKSENKYIFVDCFATWCGPCKEMDKNVYPSEKVGVYLNNKFISVRVQMDSTKKDNEQVKAWYADAQNIQSKYEVTAFPTYLFFSPDGKIVHRGLGYKAPDDFILLASEASNPSKQCYTLLEDYKRGRRDYETMGNAALSALMLQDPKLANIIARDYKKNYLDKLKEEELCTKENIEFIRHFPDLVNSKDGYFKLFYYHADKVDKIEEGLSRNFVQYIITKEEVDNKLWKDNKPITRKPDWNRISTSIREKYNGSYVESIVPTAKLNFYKHVGNWMEYAKLIEMGIKNNPPKSDGRLSGDAWRFNVMAWDVFLHCDDKRVLSKALEWSELSIKLEQPNPNVQYLDTKANLLYKLGRVKEAIELEEKALQQDTDDAQKRGEKKGGLYDIYNANLSKMKQGIPTW